MQKENKIKIIWNYGWKWWQNALYWTLVAALVSIFVWITVTPKRRAQDPAITALEEANYTKIHFVGDRSGFCDPDPRYAQVLIEKGILPKLDRKDSYSKECTFGDLFIA